MKQILKIILLCSLLCAPFSVMAQEDFVAPEKTDMVPVLDNGLDTESQVNEQAEDTSIKTEELPVIVSTTDIIAPKPLIHIEQLGWNTFKFRSSYRLGLEQYETDWSFGDGQVSSQRIVHHTYTKPGIYQVRLEILTNDGQTHIATNTVQVGFFNLANWRLWILIVLLAVIIIIAAIIAGVTEGNSAITQKKKKKLLDDFEDESVLNSLTERLGDLDSLGQIGLDTNALADELAFLEEMDVPEIKKKRKRKAIKPKEKKKIKVKTKKKPKKKTTVTKTKAKKKTVKKKATKSKKSVKK